MSAHAPDTNCPVYAGSDPCYLRDGHAGDHRTRWGSGVVMTWRGDEAWSYRIPRQDAS